MTFDERTEILCILSSIRTMATMNERNMVATQERIRSVKAGAERIRQIVKADGDQAWEASEEAIGR